MEDGVTPRLTEDELKNLYRNVKGQFLFLHRIMVRHGLVGDKERIVVYDLTNKPK
ncbi:MAG: hypothetical protein OEW25_03805 [Nitrospira sp.]|nr:hypothetical protein [Nitrospira sp.]